MNACFLLIGIVFGIALAFAVAMKIFESYKAGDLEIVDYEDDLAMCLSLECEVPVMRSKKYVILRVKNSSYYEKQ